MVTLCVGVLPQSSKLGVVYRTYLEAVVEYLKALNSAVANIAVAPGVEMLKPYLGEIPVLLDGCLCGFLVDELGGEFMLLEATPDMDVMQVLQELEAEMLAASASMHYEKAALLRDQIMELKQQAGLSKIEPKAKPVTYPKTRSPRKPVKKI